MVNLPFYLSLLIGPAVPIPAPKEVMDALVSIEVNSGEGDAPGGFQLVFKLDKRSPLLTLFLISGGAAIPLVRVVIIVTVGGIPQSLMDGVMTNHQVTTGEGGITTLTITGEDLSRVMDYIDFSGTPFPGMSVEARVATILAKYAGFGIVPLIIPKIFPTVDNPLECIPIQCGTDLQYLRKMAEEVGYTFHLIPGPAPGTSTAFWGPKVRFGPVQPALSFDMDAHTNVESLSCNFDSQSATTPVVYVQEPITKATIPIPLPQINPLSPPLGAIPPPVLKIGSLRDTAKLSPPEATMKGLAKADESARAVSCSGNLRVKRYGRLLKARQLVGVRGMGLIFDGLYFVDRVSTTLSRGEINQQFQLSRNELMSNVPGVLV